MAQDLVPGDSLMPLYRRVVKQHDKDYEHLWQPYYRYWEPTHHAVDRFAYGPCSTAISFTDHNENQFDNTPGNLEPTRRSRRRRFAGGGSGEMGFCQHVTNSAAIAQMSVICQRSRW